MAETTIDAAKIKDLESALKSAQAISDTFYQKATAATGAAAQQLENIGAIYSSMAKNQNESLIAFKKIIEASKKRTEITEELLKLEKELKALEGDSKKAKEAEIAVQKTKLDLQVEELQGLRKLKDESDKNTKAQKNAIKDLTTSQTLLGKLADTGLLKTLGWVGGTAQIVKGLQGAGRAAQDVVDISLASGSFLGMSGDIRKDFLDLGAATWKYSSALDLTKIKMAGLGISVEETTGSFKKFSQITEWTDHSAESMATLTEATGYLATALQVSLGDATDYVVESNLKFGRTGTQSAMVLKDIRDTTEEVNTRMHKTVVIGKDVTKVLFDLAHESNAGAQEQDLFSKMLIKNMVALQAQGYSYKTSLESATMYIKKLTTEAPEWGRILAGRDLGETIKKAW